MLICPNCKALVDAPAEFRAHVAAKHPTELSLARLSNRLIRTKFKALWARHPVSDRGAQAADARSKPKRSNSIRTLPGGKSKLRP